MKICIMGTGYVGLVTGTCFAEMGLYVTCVDTNVSKIDKLRRGEPPIYEPGLEELLKKGMRAGRLHFTTDIPSTIRNSSVIFIAVGTPTQKDDDQADLTAVFKVADMIAAHAENHTVVITKSTVPVDTAKKLERYIKSKNPSLDVDTVSNPEFLREGSAIEDFMRPDRIVIGCRSKRAEMVMRKLYAPFSELETPIIFTSPESAELIKYAANSFLAAKITFINEVATLAEKCGADVQDVALGMGLDNRIGKKFLMVGPGYGGSCFPKDTRAMAQTGRAYEAPLTIVETVIKANDARKTLMGEKILAYCGPSLKGKTLAILGVTFKADTDDMRDSPSLVIIPFLQKHGARIQAYDPAGMENAKTDLPNVHWHTDAYSCAKEADALIILTEWNAFKCLDWSEMKKQLKTPLLIDLRNLYTPQELKQYGFTYHSLGRPSVKPS